MMRALVITGLLGCMLLASPALADPGGEPSDQISPQARFYSLDAYRRAIEIRPHFASAHEYIGRLYIAMGNRETAMRQYGE